MFHFLPLIFLFNLFLDGPNYVDLNQNTFDLWNKAGLDTQIVSEEIINNENCNQNKKSIINCIYAFNKLLEILPEQKILFPPLKLTLNNSEYPYVENILESNEQYHLFQLKDESTDPENYVLSDVLRSKNKTQINAIKNWITFIENEKSYYLKANNILEYISTETKNYLNSLDKNTTEINTEDRIEAFISYTLFNSFMQAKYGDNSGIVNRLEFEKQMESKGTSFVGIGAELFKVEKGLLLTRIIQSGSAQENGLLTGDIITHVNGKDAAGRPINEVVKEIKGKAGTTVDLTVLREDKIFTKSIPRKKVNLKNVDYSILNSPSGKIGYIKLASFLNLHADKDISLAIEHIEKNNGEIIILDLRDNGGGLVDQAVAIADLFLDKGKVVYSAHYLNSNMVQVFRTKNNQKTNLPVVLLQNSNSASASELVSGALRDHHRALIVGQTSYGKGTIQNVEPSDILDNLYFTINVARFHQPNGSSNHIYGIIPDIEINTKFSDVKNKGIYRIGDISVFPIPSVKSTFIPKISSELENCYQNDGSADQDFKNSSIERSYDYELLKTIDIAKCMISIH
ncbi:MAG: PDZ domain-containing protein [Halobacteriovoraceae bacterium]|nr:PDZ domain-containing protein [Halobacteriovoraceae bacterium]